MTKILASDLEEGQVSSLAEFMKARSVGQYVLRKKSIQVNGLTNRKVRFLLNKFLHTNRLSIYRVFDTAGTFEIVSIKPEKEADSETGGSKTSDVHLGPNTSSPNSGRAVTRHRMGGTTTLEKDTLQEVALV